MNAATYFWSDKIALRTMGAQPVTEAQAPELYAMVRELATAGRAADAPAVRQPHRRSPTRSPPDATRSNAAVCVTEGILGILTPRELRGVIGHELSHVYNRDILISSRRRRAGRHHHDAGATSPGSSRSAARTTTTARTRLALLLMLILGPLAADASSSWRSAGAASTRPTRPARSSPATRWPWPARCARSTWAPRRCRCRRRPARQHRPPDDRQPVPRRRHAQAVLHPPADGGAGAPGWRRWPPTPARCSTSADPERDPRPRPRPGRGRGRLASVGPARCLRREPGRRSRQRGEPVGCGPASADNWSGRVSSTTTSSSTPASR